MKKLFLGALLLVFAGVMAACGSNNGAESGKKEIVVAATKTPHAEILKEAEPLLKEKGYTLKVKVLSDYKMYNKASFCLYIRNMNMNLMFTTWKKRDILLLRELI